MFRRVVQGGGSPLAEHGRRQAVLGLSGLCSGPTSQFAGNLGCKSECEPWTVAEAGCRAAGSRLELARPGFSSLRPGSPPPPEQQRRPQVQPCSSLPPPAPPLTVLAREGRAPRSPRPRALGLSARGFLGVVVQCPQIGRASCRERVSSPV